MSAPLVKCCGKLRETPFCPICGEKLDTDPLYGLLAHCRTIHKRVVSDRKGWEANIAESKARNMSSTYAEARLAKSEQACAKYDAWISRLKEVLNLEDETSGVDS